MSAGKIAASWLAALLLSSCGASYKVYRVTGVNDKFCLPNANAIERIPWIPSSVPEEKDFAFGGCWQADLNGQDGCPFPKMVRGGVVSPAKSFRGQLWQDVDNDSMTKRVILGEGSLLEVVEGGRAIIASNKSNYWGWFVWRKAVPGNVTQLNNNDELLATCQQKDVALPGTTRTRPAVLCERRVLGEEYALSYSFESKGRVPIDVEKMDTQVFAGIDSWRCKK